MSMASEFQIAFRRLRRSPAFAITAITSLALGIGANSAIFSAVNAILLHPIGVENADRIVAIRVKYDKLNLSSLPLSAVDFADIRAARNMFESVAVMGEGNFNYTSGGGPERLIAAQVSSDWFKVFGAKAYIGRTFLPEEDRPGANREVLLAYATWHRLFGSDPNVIGRLIELNLNPYRIVGVTHPGFQWPSHADCWVPLGLPPNQFDEGNRFNEELFAAARLRPGVTITEANAWIKVLATRVRTSAAYARDSRWDMFAIPMTDYAAGNTKEQLTILMFTTALVLFIACGNIAGLLMARGSGRARDIAVSVALGASRWALIRPMLAESLLLALMGACFGLAITHFGLQWMLSVVQPDAQAGLEIGLDRYVFLFTFSIAIASTLLIGGVPAWQVARAKGSANALKEGGRSGTPSRGRQRFRASLVSGEVALAFVLLIGAGLFLRSLFRLQNVKTGFEATNVMTASISLPTTRYKDAEKRAIFYEELTRRISDYPGVTAVGIGVPLPFSGLSSSSSFQIQGSSMSAEDSGPHGDMQFVSPGYFRALGIPLRGGRSFSDRDRLNSDPVVLVDENLAREYWPTADPLGQKIRRGNQGPWYSIVGIVGHAKRSDLGADSEKGAFFFSILQVPIPIASIAVKTSAAPAIAISVIRNSVEVLDPIQPLFNIKTLQSMVSEELGPRRFTIVLLVLFAALALFLAGIGMYGLLTYSVSLRTHEIGIRMALGARPREVTALLLLYGVRLAVIGTVAGGLIVLGLTPLVSRLLFGVSAFDPLTLILATLVTMTATLLSCVAPGLRAARLDPSDALRNE